jgi:N-acetylglutamate synthase-like GNAT family acetyltransferase
MTALPALDLSTELRCARACDVPGIVDLIRRYSSKGLMLPKTRDQIVLSLEDFLVVGWQGTVVACGGLRVYSSRRAEVVSLAVAEAWQGLGMGAAILDALLEQGREREIAEVFAMTLNEGFFRAQGFHCVPVSDLPEKVQGDCVGCPRRLGCREIAVLRSLRTASGEPSQARGLTTYSRSA